MLNILTAIENIAKEIEDKVFSNYDDFALSSNSVEETNNNINKFCANLISEQFKKVKDVKSIIGQDTKEYTQLNNDGKYIVSYISIDNINLLDLNFSLGTIFAIYKDTIDGANLVASSYVTYGPTFQLVFATKENGVQFLSYDGDFFIEQDSFKLEKKGKINSTGGDVPLFNESHKQLMQSFFDVGYRLRFSNSLALDTHQILFKRGGIYSSPSTSKDPNGTLDLAFEAYPISFIIELAGGISIDGKNRILDIKLENNISKKTPIYFGSKDELEKVKNSFN
ncbi:MAG: hypothetical protein U9R39_07880 [Campylobacterota bacterium]|nr:hypothetical protein [Campylobacterota bacterium]